MQTLKYGAHLIINKMMMNFATVLEMLLLIVEFRRMDICTAGHCATKQNTMLHVL